MMSWSIWFNTALQHVILATEAVSMHIVVHIIDIILYTMGYKIIIINHTFHYLKCLPSGPIHIEIEYKNLSFTYR